MGKYNKNKSQKSKKNFSPDECTNKMTFQECEMAVLRSAIKVNKQESGKRIVSDEDVQKMIKIVEEFIMKKKLICYGGTAINNILPENARFYDKEAEIPDYDFFSSMAMNDAKELADIYYDNGYTNVEAKAGVHFGTYKVFVNFIPIADITQLPKQLFDSIKSDSIKRSGIHYTPPNYLRMSMYLELSRPDGDVSRWEKVLERLNLLNKYYPLKTSNCTEIDFQRKMEIGMSEQEKIYFITRDTFMDEGVVFFGGYASGLYSKQVNNADKRELQKIPDFDVLSEDLEKTALILKEQLEDNGIKNIKMKRNDAIGEVIPENIEISVGRDDIIAVIHKPIACHSYNEINMNDRLVKIATIDTIMSLYLSFVYGDKKLHDIRLLCMADYLFNIQEKNKLKQKGILKRFTNQCYGKQTTIEDIRSEKTQKFKELKNKRTSPEYQEWFLKYTPNEKKVNLSEEKDKPKKSVSKTVKKKTKTTSKNRLLKLIGL
jgi:hypothetical protein